MPITSGDAANIAQERPSSTWRIWGRRAVNLVAACVFCGGVLAGIAAGIGGYFFWGITPLLGAFAVVLYGGLGAFGAFMVMMIGHAVLYEKPPQN